VEDKEAQEREVEKLAEIRANRRLEPLLPSHNAGVRQSHEPVS